MIIINFFTNAYKGQEKPWKIFTFGFLLAAIFWAVLLNIANYINPDLVYFLMIAHIAYSFWLIFAFWNCAVNASNRFFNILTRVMAFFIAIQIYSALDILIRYPK
jgi:hypothetical protein